MKLYHGSNEHFEKINITKGRNHRDFGQGFYTTTLEDQAQSWALTLCERNGGTPFVYVYDFEFGNLNAKRFDGLTKEWLEFVRYNRTLGGVQHEFDIIIGPVANDDTMPTISRYIRGIYDVDEALKRLSFHKINDQVSFHTPIAVEALKFAESYEVKNV